LTDPAFGIIEAAAIGITIAGDGKPNTVGNAVMLVRVDAWPARSLPQPAQGRKFTRARFDALRG
jgi:hypothetical protein